MRIFNNLGINVVSKILSSKKIASDFTKKAQHHITSENKAQGILEYGIIIVIAVLGAYTAISSFKNTVTEKLKEAEGEVANIKHN